MKILTYSSNHRGYLNPMFNSNGVFYSIIYSIILESIEVPIKITIVYVYFHFINGTLFTKIVLGCVL